ncbi:YcgN family cysteine cluster protein [Shewanella sp. YIC-542]|uniref:YcgN family cysteine cluster protein n=1 Tax=Shewanella mytili TaxID=3377111 RepID=UPI00398F0E51
MSFWLSKTLSEMTQTEWEQLCDGCGKCCLNKLIDDETDELYYTCVACKLLSDKDGSCLHYPQRFEFVPECTAITPQNIASLDWLPDSCAYRRLYLGRPLPSWHPLLTGDKKLMHKKGMSIKGKTIKETRVKDLEDYIVIWPLQDID